MPTPPTPWTDELEQRVRDLHTAGRTLTAVAREVGVAPSTLSRRAARMGITWDRTRTEKATQAKVADAKSRRAQLQLDLLEDAERLRTQLWEPALVFNFGGKDNTYEERTVPKPPFADQLKIMQATGAAIDRALKLDLHDSGAGAAQVVGLLQQTAAALGLHDSDDTRP